MSDRFDEAAEALANELSGGRHAWPPQQVAHIARALRAAAAEARREALEGVAEAVPTRLTCTCGQRNGCPIHTGYSGK